MKEKAPALLQSVGDALQEIRGCARHATRKPNIIAAAFGRPDAVPQKTGSLHSLI